ncbi:MAG: LemA family protein [Candidatus Yanofskybacteria bacterium]|nr:LemA family protein [Candidatus Yanofskybacteria bacterium]
MDTPIIAGILGAVLVLWVVFSYNRLVSLRNRAKEAFSDIDVQLKRRYNLVPNLVETVKGYAAHEKGVLEEVTKARAQAMGARGVEDRTKAENMLSETLKSLFAVAENYPDLKASANFLELQRELRDTEDKIMAARRFHNTTVMSLNTSLESFPTNILANMFGFKQAAFFEVETETEKEAPSVKF